MITRIRQRFFGVRFIYSNPLDVQRAQVLIALSVIMTAILAVTFVFFQIPDVLQHGLTDRFSLVIAVVDVIALVASYRLIQSGHLKVAIWIVLILVVVGSVQTMLRGGPGGTANISTSAIIFLPIPIILAAVLLNRRGMFAISALTLLLVAIAAMSQRSNTQAIAYVPALTVSTDVVTVFLALLIIVAIVGSFLATLQRIASESFQMTAQRKWIHNIGLELSAHANEATLLSSALSRIRQSVGQRFVEIYLLNEEGNLTLYSSSGQRRTVRSIDANILAEAARSRKLLLASLQDAPEWRSHMAASTSYAAAVPIMVNDNLMGVFDFQDVVPFKQNELESLQQLADQVAISLQRVRMETELQVRSDDYEQTIKRLQTQLQDFNRRQQQNVSEIWGGYIRGRGRQAIGYNLDGTTATPIQASDLPDSLVNTLRTGQLEVSTQDSEQIINVPIKFRDANLGAMTFAVPANQPLNDRQIEVATIVAERLALALENTRLFEQSQSQALRERKASEVATALIGATDVRVVLNMAAEQFKEALGAVNTRIYIQPETLMEPLVQTQQEQ